MPIRGPNFLICVAIAAAGIGCAKAEFDKTDGGPPPEKDGPVCAPTSETCSPGREDPCSACGQKCSYVVATTDTVRATCAPQGTLGPFSQCEIYNEGTTSQRDDCGAGRVCLRPSGERGKFCFPLCGGTTDCNGVACGPRTLSSNATAVVNVCEPPYFQYGDSDFCDPLANGGCGEGRYCFLVSKDASGHSRTVCEYSEGNGRDDPPAPCNFARDCFPLFTCVDSLCKRVCQTNTTCDSGQKCAERGLEYGYCP